ncbi:hypothetical protein REPUB_Repub16aG0002800 [Reevesia pubescens]
MEEEEEEEQKKRWSVTYTKHLKQKRKVYKDGFLDLHISTNKLMLLDESEKVLECRMLRRDEVVCSAQTLTFSAFLVDVLHPSISPGATTTKSKNEGRPINLRLSPSQKIIREFKKSELQKYGAPQTTIKTNVTEWQVMYTTQVTQKAKKYHDGFLQLTNSGTLQRQIMLYDGSKKLINSRFLKKDEVIQSGESIAFDAHLVDIGEAEGNNQDPVNSDVGVSNYDVAGKTGMMHGVQNFLKTHKSFLKGKPKKIACSKGYEDPSFSISNIDETKLSQNIHANQPLRDATQILSILHKPMMQDSIAKGSTDKNNMNPILSAKEPDSDATRNILECSQLPRISIAHHGSSGKLDNLESSQCIDIKRSPELYSKGKFKCNYAQLQHYLLLGLDSVAKSSCSDNKSSENTEFGNSHQAQLDNLEGYRKWCNEESVHGSSVDLTKNSAELKISREAGSSTRCPSFDLGFD